MPTKASECACIEVLGVYVLGEVTIGQYNTLQVHLPNCAYCRAKLRVIKSLGLARRAQGSDKRVAKCIAAFVETARDTQQLSTILEGSTDCLTNFLLQQVAPGVAGADAWARWLDTVPLELLANDIGEEIKRIKAYAATSWS